MHYERARQNMVESQIRPNGIRNVRLLRRLAQVPRELFVPASQRSLAYIDTDFCVKPAHDAEGEARYLLAPALLAHMIEGLAPRPGDVALDIGCATGYSTAVLAALVLSVVSVESDAELARMATENLNALGVDNAAVVTGALEAGCASEAPFDVMLLNGAVESVPEKLFDQLAENGRLAVVLRKPGVAQAMGASQLHIYRKTGGLVSGQPELTAGAPLLPGFAAKKGFVF
jgi:protein-L-isoaspartate(D-aspartate) O-methyltransferase